MLATGIPTASCEGIDLSQNAIDFAAKHYSIENVNFRVGDACSGEWEDDAFDGAVSFETIEHLEEPSKLLMHLRRGLRDGGMFLCSTPNEEQMPFDRDSFPFHVRHYSPLELERLLGDAGFSVVEVLHQRNGADPELRPGPHGNFMVFVCE